MTRCQKYFESVPPCMVLIVWGLFAIHQAIAQHADIAVYQNTNGRITTHDSTGGQALTRVFQRNFDFWGDFGVFAGDDPGFQQAGTNPPNTFSALPGEATLNLSLVPLHIPGMGVGNVLFWDGTTPDVDYGALPDNHLFYVEDATTVVEVALDGTPARFNGLVAGVTDSLGGMHEHLTFAVENNGQDPLDGIYLMGWQLELAGSQSSQLVVVGLSADTLSFTVRNQSSDWLSANVDFFRIAGDFDDSGDYTTDDADALVGAIVAGQHPVEFDLTLDGQVDINDLDTWRALAGSVLFDTTTVAGQPTSGAAVLPGDANLEGFVDVSDFNLWNGSKFTSSPAWSTGDFNADGFVDVPDFNIWNSRKFSSVDSRNLLPSAVPEPTAAKTCFLLTTLLLYLRRSR